MHHASSAADCAAFILAGGKSTRMGTDKAFVMLNGRTLLENALYLARTVTANVTIVGAVSKFHSFAPVVEDSFPNCGPLGGIHTALRTSMAELNLILAVDTPFIPPALLQYLIAQTQIARKKTGQNSIAIVPRTRDGWQPLCAIYRREFADTAETALRQRNYKIDVLFSQIRVQAVEEPELAGLGFSPQIFCNLNTQEELTTAGGSLAQRKY